jgi:hypothetical protein
MSDDSIDLLKKYAAATNRVMEVIVLPTGEVGLGTEWHDSRMLGMAKGESLSELLRDRCAHDREEVYRERDQRQQQYINDLALLEKLPF